MPSIKLREINALGAMPKDYYVDGLVINITYKELKKLRDSHQLVAGQRYRIIDYVTTTCQEGTRSAGHQFDIIVTADDDHTLNENAKAADHEVLVPVIYSERIDVRYTQIVDTEEEFNTDHPYWKNFNNEYKGPRKDQFDFIGYLDDGSPVVYLNDDGYEGIIDENTDYYKYDGQRIFNGMLFDSWLLFERSVESGEMEPRGVYKLTDTVIDSKGKFDSKIIKTKYKNTSYFKDCNLAAWELKYCLDNDKKRFAWAKKSGPSYKVIKAYEDYDDSSIFLHVRMPEYDTDGKFAWCYIVAGEYDGPDGKSISELTYDEIKEYVKSFDSGDMGYTDTEDIIPGVTIIDYYGYQGQILEYREIKDEVKGKGVIYYMKDEWNNECPYDFKNIQFVRTNEWQGHNIKWLSSVIGFGLEQDSPDLWFYTFSWYNENREIEDLSIVGQNIYNDDSEYRGCNNNIIKEYVLTDYDKVTTTSRIKLNNIIFVSSYFYESGWFYGCVYNIFDYSCGNIILGNGCSYNKFENNNDNYYMFNLCKHNTFRSFCHDNTLASYCNYNVFNEFCCFNKLSQDCSDNVFGNLCTNNTLGAYCCENTFGLLNSSNTLDERCTSNNFGAGCYSNIIGFECYKNNFDIGCNHIEITGTEINHNTFGIDCSYIYCSENYCRYNKIKDGVKYILLKSNSSSKYTNQLQYITLFQGVQGSSKNNLKTIVESRNLDHDVVYHAVGYETKTV